MSDVNLLPPVRDYIRSLVHASARGDALTVARHRGFIAPRILGGLAALSALPIYLLARGGLSVLEAVVFAWFIAPISTAYFLSRTGRYEQAHVLSALSLTAVVTLVAMMSGGIASPAAVWLVLAPLEAALCASRRVVVFTAVAAFVAAGLLFAFGGEPKAVPTGLYGVSVALAIAYAGLLALGAESLARMGSELLNSEEERYRLLALNMTDVISRHGRGGITLFVSPAAEKLFGTAPRELLGHGLFDRVHVADRPAYLTALADAAAGSEACSVEFRVRQRKADEARQAPHFIWVEMRCQTLGESSDGAGASLDHPGNVVAVMRDVTERKVQQQIIADARAEAEQANEAKSRFLATMSHELRTPLNAVIGFSEMLMNEEAMPLDAERRRDYARLIHDSGHHLLSVVNLVLDMSKIDTGKFVITAEAFAPGPVIHGCCDLMALKAREAGLDIVLKMPVDLPEMVADKRALKQMLFNLLSNAIKFTDRGGKVTVSATVDGRDLVAIAVEDTGVGICADDLPHVGDAFFQARGSYNRPYEGTGLGLSIVKGLVELHSGRMWVESRIGVGTCVTIHLPIDCERGERADRRTVVDLAAAVRPEAPTEPQAAGPADAEQWSRTEVKKSA